MLWQSERKRKEEVRETQEERREWRMGEGGVTGDHLNGGGGGVEGGVRGGDAGKVYSPVMCLLPLLMLMID